VFYPVDELRSHNWIMVDTNASKSKQMPDSCTARIRNGPDKGLVAKHAEDLAREWRELAVAKQCEFVRKILRRVMVSRKTMWIEIDKTKPVATLLGQISEALQSLAKRKPDVLELTSDFQIHRQ